MTGILPPPLILKHLNDDHFLIDMNILIYSTFVSIALRSCIAKTQEYRQANSRILNNYKQKHNWTKKYS